MILTNFALVNVESEIEEDTLVLGWSKDARLTNNSEESLHPSIAVDSKNNVYVVWQDTQDISQGYGRGIYFTKSTDKGETWSLPKRLSALSYNGTTPDCITPHVIIDQNDIIHVVWSGVPPEEPYNEIYYKRSTDGGRTWYEDVRLTYAPSDSYTPRIATRGNTLHVVWSDKRDGNFEIYYKKSDNGGNSWTEDKRLTNDVGPSKLPTIAVDLLGRVHIAWYDQRDTVYKIYYRESLDDGNSWGNETCISQGHNLTTLIADFPEFLVDSYNNIHLFWEDGPFGEDDIFYRKKIGTDLWEPEKNIVSGKSRAAHPSPVIDSINGLHLIWDDDRERRDIYYKASADLGDSWGPEIKLTNSSFVARSGIAWDPKAAIDLNNIIHIVWIDERDGNKEIYYKRTLNPVSEPPIVVTQSLSQTTCKPGTPITVSGKATWNTTLLVNANVNVKILETNQQWFTTTDTNGNYNLTIIAPSTPGSYTVRVTVIYRNLTGGSLKKLTITQEISEKKDNLMNFLWAGTAVGVGIIIAVVLFRMRKAKPSKVEKSTEEQRLDVEFPSGIQMITLRCPECRMTFSIEMKPKPFGIKCPNCGKEGVVR
ncbi:MAG: hypothetical protein AB1485_05160 [Candidatus Thermoplasmatota archaeon]